MRVFTCNDFIGYWPVGTAAVIVAEDEAAALKVLKDQLVLEGLDWEQKDLTIKPLSLKHPIAVILNDGNY